MLNICPGTFKAFFKICVHHVIIVVPSMQVHYVILVVPSCVHLVIMVVPFVYIMFSCWCHLSPSCYHGGAICVHHFIMVVPSMQVYYVMLYIPSTYHVMYDFCQHNSSSLIHIFADPPIPQYHTYACQFSLKKNLTCTYLLACMICVIMHCFKLRTEFHNIYVLSIFKRVIKALLY